MSEPKAGEAEIVKMPLAEKPAAPTEAAAPAAPLAPAKKRNGRRNLILVSVPVLLAAVGGYFYLTGGRYQDTDNAYVQQAKVSLSADVGGRITTVAVKDNQIVKAGDTLFTLDAEPYQIALAQADAALATARVNVEQLKVAYGTAQAQLTAMQSTLVIRQAAFDRKNSLVESGTASDATLDDVKLALETARNGVIAAQ
ncbi:MAG: biotin/lipoyl-binding protein [Devosia sp.]